jgi:hypothetical protein
MSFAVKQSDNTDTTAERQPAGVALSGGPRAVTDNGTEAVREAAWEIIDILDHGAMTWAQIASEASKWSEPTLRRACRHLKAVGAVVFFRNHGLWARVDGVAIPPRLWPHAALLAAVLELQGKSEATP